MKILKWLSVADRFYKIYLDEQLAPFGINSSQHICRAHCRFCGVYPVGFAGEQRVRETEKDFTEQNGSLTVSVLTFSRSYRIIAIWMGNHKQRSGRDELSN